jgi:UPF0148 protein
MQEDRNVKKMASLLKQGATMLDKYCPICENILFKLKNNKIFCPVCEQEVIIVKEVKKAEVKNSEVKQGHNSTFYEINNNLSRFLNFLIQKLENLQDMDYTLKILENIEKTLDILNKIRTFQK